MTIFKTCVLVLAGLLIGTSLSLSARAQENSSDNLEQKKQEIEELQKKLLDVQGQKQTLSSTIQIINNRIALTKAQIEQTQTQLVKVKSEIGALSRQITVLDTSLNEITDLLVNRISQTYKRSQVNPFFALLSSQDLGSLLARYKYLQLIARNDRQVIYQMEVTKTDFQKQKQLKEEKQIELDELNTELLNQQASLAKQQNEKQSLLEVTKNDEKKFQGQLAEKLAELEAIQSIIAGKGEETEVGDVKQGDKIAQVIAGPSTCSSGAHLHLEVAEKGIHKNPASYLSNKSVTWDNSPDGSFNFTGSWSWPLNDTVRITQGYGMTFYAATLRYYGGAPHTGIDMVNNSDYVVKATADGKLYRGAIGCRGGTLRYVRVQHNSDLSSYYLHVNY